MARRIGLIFTLFALVLAACGDDDAADDDTPGTTTTAAGDTGGDPSDATITIQGFSFGDSVTVSVGESVTVVNEDAPTHTWTASDGTFDSGNIGSGETFEFTFDTAGEFRFSCQIHPQMTGSITVEG